MKSSRRSTIWNTPTFSVPSSALLFLLFQHGARVSAYNLGVEKAPAMTAIGLSDMQELKVRQEASPAPSAAASTPAATDTNVGTNTPPEPTGSISAAKPDVSASLTTIASESETQANLFCNAGSYVCPSSVGYGCCPLGLACRPNDCYGFVTSGSGALPSVSNVVIDDGSGPITASRSAPLFTEVPAKKKLSGGAIGGIAAGAIIGGILLGVLLFFAFKRWKKWKKDGPYNPYPTPHPSMHQVYPSHTVNAPPAGTNSSSPYGGGAGTHAAGAATAGGTMRSHKSNHSGTYSPSASVAGYYNVQHKRQPSQTRSVSQMSQGSYAPTPPQYIAGGGGGGGGTPGAVSPPGVVSPPSGTPGAGTPGSGTIYGAYPPAQFSRSGSGNDSIPTRGGAVSPVSYTPGSPQSVASNNMSLSHVRTLSLGQGDYNPPVASWPTGYNPPVASSPVFEVEGSTPTPLAPVPGTPMDKNPPKLNSDEKD